MHKSMLKLCLGLLECMPFLFTWMPYSFPLSGIYSWAFSVHFENNLVPK